MKNCGLWNWQDVFLEINIQMTLPRGIMQIYMTCYSFWFAPTPRHTTSIVKLQTWAINTKRIVWAYTVWAEIYIIMACFHYSSVYYNYSYHANDATTHMKRTMWIFSWENNSFIIMMCINIFLFHLCGFWNDIKEIRWVIKIRGVA